MTDSPAEKLAALSEAFEPLEKVVAAMAAALAEQWPENSRMERAAFMLRNALFKIRAELEHREQHDLDPDFLAAGVSLFSGLPHERACSRRMAVVYEKEAAQYVDETST